MATTADDRYRALQMLQSIGASDSSLYVVVHSGNPASKARARIVRGHAYTPDKTRVAQASLAHRLRGVPTFNSNVAVSCVFHRSNRQRIDVDNLVKLVMDAATQASVWKDDSQVTALVAVLEHDTDHPRTVVAFADHDSTMLRGESAMAKCEACGNPYHATGPGRRFCSRACRMSETVILTCPVCGMEFRKRGNYRKYCSVPCRGKAQASLAKKRQARRTHCKHGHELTEENTHFLANGYRRCRTCQAEQARRYRQK